MAAKEKERTSEYTGDVQVEVDTVQPKRRIGLLGAVAFGVGSIIGSGIFVSPKGALRNTESIGMSIIIWAVTGGIALIIGLVYSELGTLVHKSGGDYTYINTGIGSLPAFLTAWIQTIFGIPGGMSVLSLVFADYLCAPIFGSCIPPDSIRKSIAATMILSIAITNIISVKFAAYTQTIFTVAKMTALLIIIMGGIVYLAKGKTEYLEGAFNGSSSKIASYTLAIYSCMFAYGGNQRINEITEELINPKQNIPRATIISILSATAAYVLTNLSYFVLITKSEFLKSSAVAYDWGLKGISPAAVIIPLSVMCSVYGAANGGAFAVARIQFAAAREGHMPEIMSFLHLRTSIPVMSIIIPHAIALILLIPANISMLINLISFTHFIVTLLTTIAAIRIRYKAGSEQRLFKIPIVIHVLSILICIFMIVSPFTSNPPIELLYGAGFVGVGIVAYFPLVYFKLSMLGTDHITCLLQLLMQLCPTEKI